MLVFIGILAAVLVVCDIAWSMLVRGDRRPMPHPSTGWPRPPIGRVPVMALLCVCAAALALAVLPNLAHAAIVGATTDVVAIPTASLDLTAVMVAVVGGVFAVIKIVAETFAASRIKDATAREVVNKALDNSLGALQQAAQGEIAAMKPAIAIPGVAARLAPGVQYVLDHAGDEAARLGITPEALADKINARIGVQNIATNLAVSASAAPAVAKPLDPVPVVVALPA